MENDYHQMFPHYSCFEETSFPKISHSCFLFLLQTNLWYETYSLLNSSSFPSFPKMAESSPEKITYAFLYKLRNKFEKGSPYLLVQMI